MNVDTLIDQVKTEVTHLCNDAPPSSDEFRKQVAISLVGRIPVLLSSAIYSSLLAGGSPPRGLHNTLATGAGICGDQVVLAITVLEALGIPHRDVQIFYRDDANTAHNHTVVEMMWGDAWRMVDVTWGFIPHRGSLSTALSYEDAARGGHREGLHHSAIPWRRAVEDRFDIFGYLTEQRDALFYDGYGFTEVLAVEGPIEMPHPTSIYRFGRVHHRAEIYGERTLAVAFPAGSWSLTLRGELTSAGEIAFNKQRQEVDSGAIVLDLRRAGPDRMNVGFSPAKKSGALQLESLEGRRIATPSHDQR